MLTLGRSYAVTLNDQKVIKWLNEDLIIMVLLSIVFACFQVGNSQVWGCHLPARSPPEQSYPAPPAYMSMGQVENMIPPPPPDSSKAPGYRAASQRMVNSPIGMTVK